VLSREQAGRGIYPAVDPLQSTSRMMDRLVLGRRHYETAEAVRAHLARYAELEDIITMLGLEELSREDRRIVHRARRLQRYLTQPFHVTSAHTGIAGVSVPLGTALDECDGFLNGEFDARGEDECYMRGAMREAQP
jgi:F-type H+-transporting ATPase subunit beta